MARACTVVGSVLAILGVAVALLFIVVIARDDVYRRAQLIATRNPGNAMYDAEFGVARIRRGFETVGVVAGLLLALNGATLLGLGVIAGRRHERPSPS